MEKQTDQFDAMLPDGETIVVYVYTEFIAAGGAVTGPQFIEGLKRLETEDGRAVNRIDKGRYEIIGRPMIPITSEHPGAP